MKPVIIGISGGTGSGKTFIAKKIKERYTNQKILIIEQDSFYNDFSHLKYKDRTKINFDHPSSIDYELLVEKIELLSTGEKIQLPNYDFSMHIRKDNDKFFYGSNIIIVEGIFTLYFPIVREFLTIKIYIDTPKDLRLKRRLKRDTKERQRSIDSIKNQFNSVAQPMHKKFIEPTKNYADIIINGGDNISNIMKALKIKLDAVIV